MFEGAVYRPWAIYYLWIGFSLSCVWSTSSPFFQIAFLLYCFGYIFRKFPKNVKWNDNSFWDKGHGNHQILIIIENNLDVKTQLIVFVFFFNCSKIVGKTRILKDPAVSGCQNNILKISESANGAQGLL